jgi:hypothetical protein
LLGSKVLGITAIALEHKEWFLLDDNLLNRCALPQTHPISWNTAVDTENQAVKLHELPVLGGQKLLVLGHESLLIRVLHDPEAIVTHLCVS